MYYVAINKKTITMTDSQTPLPQPQLKPKGITSEQYFDYTPEKLELSRGFYNYGGQDFLGFQLAVLTNMGLLKAIRNVGISLWIQALDEYMRERWASPSLDKWGQPCLLDPRYPTTFSDEGCPHLSWVVAGEAAEDEKEVMLPMMNRLNRAMDDLAVVAEFLGEPLPPVEFE